MIFKSRFSLQMPPPVAKLARTIHWISSAICLMVLLFFALTGFTLNRADWFLAETEITVEQWQLSEVDWQAFQQADPVQQLSLLSQHLHRQWGLDIPLRIDRDNYEWLLDYPRPGGVTTVLLDLETGVLMKEQVNDGVVALLNDLHKGRYSGEVWRIFIDISALLSVIFGISGLLLLWVYARKRPSTWPLVIVGGLIPLLLFWMFVP